MEELAGVPLPEEGVRTWVSVSSSARPCGMTSGSSVVLVVASVIEVTGEEPSTCSRPEEVVKS